MLICGILNLILSIVGHFIVAKGVRRKSEERKSLFSKEIIGMAIILFSVLSFLCLVIGDVIYPVGGIVRGFFLGVFGYYAFPFLIVAVSLGVKLVVSKPIFSKRGRRAISVIYLLIFAIFALIHIVVSLKGDQTFTERVALAYGDGAFNLSNATFGGALVSIIAHPLLTFLSRFLTYAIFALIIGLCVFYLINKFVGARDTEEKPKEKKKKEPKNAPSVQLPLQTDNTSAEEYARGFGAQSEKQNSQPTISGPKYNGLYIFGDDSFVPSQPKSRKDKKNAQNTGANVDFVFGQGSTPFGDSRGYGATYSDTYVDDLESKLKYVTTPRAPDLTNLGQTPFDAKNPSAQTNIAHTREYSDYSVGGETKDVYRTTRTSRAEPIDTFKRAQESSVSGGYEPKDGFGSRRDTLGSASQGVKSDAFGSIFDRNPSENYGGQPSSGSRTRVSEDRDVNSGYGATDRFARAEIKTRDETVQKTENPTRDSGFSEKTSEDTSNRVYNPLKTEKTVESSSERISRETMGRQNQGVRESDVEVRDINEETPLERSNVTRESFGSSKTGNQTPKAVGETPRAVTPVTPITTTPKVKEVKTEEPAPEKPNPIDTMPVNYRYKAPPLSIFNDVLKDEEAMLKDRQKQLERAEKIVSTLSFRNIKATVEDIIYGPSVTRFVISVPQGVQMSAIKAAQQELQVWLEATSDIRMLIPIPGTSKIGIEVANSKTGTVGIKELLGSKQYKSIKENTITFALGKDIVGNPIFLDVMDMPHLIVAGATGTGKSVCLNTMLISLLYRYSPEDLRLIIVDPKMVEFEMYKGLPHLMFNDIIGINDGRALAMLEWATIEMDRRYMMFKDVGARKLVEYNAKVATGAVERKLPYIIILIDEFAELMMTAQEKKKVENYVGRLAQKARAAGISLIFATQRPSADVIDGSIKTNFTSRICFKTSSSVDSNVVIGQSGAETLLGKGDVLYKMTSMPNVERAQGAFISDEEVKAATDYIRDHNRAYYDEKALEMINKANQEKEQELVSAKSSGENEDPDAIEDVYLRALRVVIINKKVSKTSLQSKLGIGYPKAAKIIDWMEENGYVSSVLDNKERKVLITREMYTELFGDFDDDYRKK